jgi:membrane protease YdiL (CAAX protease family)
MKLILPPRISLFYISLVMLPWLIWLGLNGLNLTPSLGHNDNDWFELLFVVGIIPIGEEIIFRGKIQSYLKHKIPYRWLAITGVNLCYVLTHIVISSDPIYLLLVALGGIMLSLLKEFKNCIWLPIVAHCYFKLCVFLLN